MRRKDREITDKAAIEAILQRAQVCRIALADGEQPYIVPVCFGYEPGRLYFHSATEGRKLDILRRNDRVCFEAEADAEFIPADQACEWTVRFSSVIGFGKAAFVENPEEKEHALQVLMQHYGGQTTGFGDLRRVAVIRIDVEEMTGKRSG